MAHTLSAPPADKPAAARSVPRLLLAGGITAGPLFLCAGVAQGLTRNGFDFTRNALSQLSLGALGWIQVTVFLLTGVLVIAGAAGIFQVLRGAPGGTWAPRLIGIFGASFLLAAFFAPDPGAGFPAGAPQAPAGTLSAHGAAHMVAAVTGYLALCAAFLVLARYFIAHGQRGWSLVSRLVPVGVLAGFAASSASVAAFTAGAGLGLLWLTALSARCPLHSGNRSRLTTRSTLTKTATHRTDRRQHPMTAPVKGPASYFPSIEKKYGRPIAEWKDLIRTSPLTKHMELVAWLKAEHGLGHGHANALVAHTLAEDTNR